MFFDTHTHYDDARFDDDRHSVLETMLQSGVELILNPGCTAAGSRAVVGLAEQYPHVYAAVGIHPEDCAEAGDEDFEALRSLCAHEKVLAVGEIGLDYYWPENPPREFQQAVFRRQIELALELNKPVIIHDRESHADSLSIVKEYPALRGVFHCFSGSAEMAEELLRRGWYLGFDGPITYKNARKALEVLSITPADRILLETDSPYMPPVPHRGERNDSRFLPLIAETVAAVKGLTVAEVAGITMENGKRLFGLL